MIYLITGLPIMPYSITDTLSMLDKLGFFRYVFPALLIFAVIYGILSKSNIFGNNKGVNAIISGGVALLSLQFNIVPDFFANIFPLAGVGISILLVGLILMGLFGDWSTDSQIKKIFLWVGAIIALIVIISALTNSGAWIAGYWWEQYAPAIITLGIIVALGWAVVGFKNGSSSGEKGGGIGDKLKKD